MPPSVERPVGPDAPARDPASDPTEWLGVAGRTALVTGAASGIGLAIARALLQAGASVECIDRNPAAAEVAEDLARATGGRIRTHHADVRDRAGLEAVRDALAADGVGLDILVPNAGINVRKPLLELSGDESDAIIATNLNGVVATLQVFGPLLFGRQDAAVVVMSSAAADHGMNLRAVYSATKAGVSGLVRSVAIEWGPRGVRVNAVAPGIIRTPLTEAYMRSFPEREAAAQAEVALRRVGAPEEVADVVLMLAGRPSRFMTGQTVFVDGGLTAGTNWW